MPLVAPNTFRLSVIGQVGSRSYANVFHVQPLGGTPPAVNEAATLLAQAYEDNFLPNVCNDLTVSGVNYVDLTDEDGDSGTVGWPGGPATGALGTAALPPQVSVLIHWDAVGNRRQRNGRTYLGAVPSANVFETGLLATEWVTQITDAAEGFLADLETAELALSVLSVVNDIGQPRAISAANVDARVATQRRRNRR